MESPQPEVLPAKKNQTLLIVAISAVVLCCCCAALAIAGYYGYNTLSVSESDTQPFDQSTPEFDEFVTEPANDFDIPEPDLGIGDAPTGGLGNDILRNDTWAYIAFASMGQGCDQPLGEETIIEVLQEPQDGVWVEKWTVACASGASYAYEVEYILDDSGATFNIKSLP